jgi:flagellar hook assembly protein FlgD
VGFTNGIKSYIETAGKVSSQMATSAKASLSEAIGKIRDLVDIDIDTQPTIRPVLDLSDIKSGASTLSSLFNSTTPIAAYATAGSIGTVTSHSGQNGDNSDVVSAIDKLRRDMGNADRAIYNINGVTYDDGSNISDAVRTIVRAARIERRS